MSGPAHDSPQDLAAAYALGALSPDETARFEAWLAGSPEAQREVAEYREVAALLALAGPDAQPGEALRARLLARVTEQKTSRIGPAPARGARPSSAPWVALAASLLAAVGLGLGLLSTKRQVAHLETELSSRATALAQTERRLSERQATLDAILGPNVQLIQLTANGRPEPGIQLFYDRQRHRAIVHGFRLEPVPSGRAYQLWFIKDGKPVPSVTFRPGPDGHATVEGVAVPAEGALSAAAVTIEPESGSPQPTSPIVLVGTLPKS